MGPNVLNCNQESPEHGLAVWLKLWLKCGVPVP